MKKMFFLVLLLSAITASYAFLLEEQPKYENLKVLPKNTTKQQMDSIMRHFSQSLGVKCNYCHVRETEGQKNFNFASDSLQKKLIARDMYKMMNKINKKYFKEDDDEHEEHNQNLIPEVSCFTCHNGKEHPENRPPAPQRPH